MKNFLILCLLTLTCSLFADNFHSYGNFSDDQEESNGSNEDSYYLLAENVLKNTKSTLSTSELADKFKEIAATLECPEFLFAASVFGNTSSSFVVCEFYLNGCPHCRQFAPIWNSISSEFSSQYRFERCEASENESRVSSNNVSSFPTVILYQKNGNQLHELERHVGSMTAGQFRNMIHRCFGN